MRLREGDPNQWALLGSGRDSAAHSGPHFLLPIRAMMKTGETEDALTSEDNIYVYLNAVCLKASVSILSIYACKCVLVYM